MEGEGEYTLPRGLGSKYVGQMKDGMWVLTKLAGCITVFYKVQVYIYHFISRKVQPNFTTTTYVSFGVGLSCHIQYFKAFVYQVLI